jgi:hypothetical protein
MSLQSLEPSAAAPQRRQSTSHYSLQHQQGSSGAKGALGGSGICFMAHSTPPWHNTSPEEGGQGKFWGEGGRKPMPRGGNYPTEGPGNTECRTCD